MLWIGSGAIMLVTAWILLKLSSIEEFRVEQSFKTLDEDDDYDPLAQQDSKIPRFLENYFQGMLIEPNPQLTWLLIVVLAGIIAAAIVVLPATLGVLLSLMTVLSVHVMFQIISSGKKRKIVLQLPSFLNQVARRLSAGTSTEHAFLDSVESLSEPLEKPMKRVMQRTFLGMELHQAFERESRVSKIREFRIIATAVRINEQFGGSIRSILEDIVDILRLDDLGKRELKSQTGETRVSAVVLALMPIVITVFLISANPAFLEQMWVDAAGKQLLIVAAVMQISGILVLWRMVRTI